MKFTYTNHRDQVEERNVTPIALVYMGDPETASQHLAGYSPGWFLECITHDRRNDLRHFALSRISTPQPGDLTDAAFDAGTLRLPIPSGQNVSWGIPDIVRSVDRDAYFEGFGKGHKGAPFDFDRTTAMDGMAWAHGYNDGRRSMLSNGPAAADIHG